MGVLGIVINLGDLVFEHWAFASQTNDRAEGIWSSLYTPTDLILSQVWNWVQGVRFGRRHKLERSQLSDEIYMGHVRPSSRNRRANLRTVRQKKWNRTFETLWRI